MPAQSSSPKVAFYQVLDTAPDYDVFLEDGDGNRINLTGATVTIDIAYSSYSYYYSPYIRLVESGACVVDADQSANKGLVHYTPGAADFDTVGTFFARFLVIYSGGGRQSIPPNTYLPIVLRERVGG